MLYTNMGVVTPGSVSTVDVDVLLVNGQNTAVGSNADALRSFVASGGGVLIASETHSWGNSASKLLVDHPTNKFLAPLVSSASYGKPPGTALFRLCWCKRWSVGVSALAASETSGHTVSLSSIPVAWRPSTSLFLPLCARGCRALSCTQTGSHFRPRTP